jgi:hypothetical protein
MIIGYRRIKDAFIDVSAAVLDWLQDRSDGEQLIMASFFVLLLMALIVQMSLRREDGVARNFIGALFMVVVFAFGLGWMIDADFGPAALNLLS